MARKKNEQSVGKKIARLRRERGLSILNLANETGLTPEFVANVEAGKVLPPVAFLIRISKALSIDAASLLSAEEERIILVWALVLGMGTRGCTPRTLGHCGMIPVKGMVSWYWAPSSSQNFLVHAFTAGNIFQYRF